MKQIFSSTKIYLLLTFTFLLVTGIILLSFSKSEIHLAITKHYSAIADFIFKYYTNVGDGFFALIIAIGFLFYNYRYALMIFTATQIAGFFAQVVKRKGFNYPRPLSYFHDKSVLHIVKDVDMNYWMSFPSGHSTTAFCLFFCLSFIAPKPIYQILFFIFALLVGYSRMYLSQHFLMDVFGGCIIGITVAIFSCYLFEKIKNPKFDNSLLKIKLN